MLYHTNLQHLCCVLVEEQKIEKTLIIFTATLFREILTLHYWRVSTFLL